MSSSTFQPEWFTIPEFAHTQPVCMYHKESEGMPSDGCTAGTQADSRGNHSPAARRFLLLFSARTVFVSGRQRNGETDGFLFAFR